MVQTTPFCKSYDGKMAEKHLICFGPQKPLLLLCTASNCIKMTCFTYLTYQLVSLWTCQCICLSTLAVESENVTEIWKIKSEESAIAFYVYFVVHVYLHANVCACEHAHVFVCARVCALTRVRICACAHTCVCAYVRVRVRARMYWALARAQLCGWALHIDAFPLFTQANLLNLSDQTKKHCYVSSSRYRNDMIYRLNLPSENFVYIGWEKEFFLLFLSNFYSNFFTHFSKI